MAKKSKKPVLRKGLTIYQLIGNHYSFKIGAGERRCISDYPETEMLAHELVLAAVQLLIDHVDAGNGVGRMEVTQMFSRLSRSAACVADCINPLISDGSVCPTLLDKVAEV